MSCKCRNCHCDSHCGNECPTCHNDVCHKCDCENCNPTVINTREKSWAWQDSGIEFGF